MKIHLYALCIVLSLSCAVDVPIKQAEGSLASLKADRAELMAIRDMAGQILVNNPGLVLPVGGK